MVNKTLPWAWWWLPRTDASRGLSSSRATSARLEYTWNRSATHTMVSLPPKNVLTAKLSPAMVTGSWPSTTLWTTYEAFTWSNNNKEYVRSSILRVSNKNLCGKILEDLFIDDYELVKCFCMKPCHFKIALRKIMSFLAFYLGKLYMYI